MSPALENKAIEIHATVSSILKCLRWPKTLSVSELTRFGGIAPYRQHCPRTCHNRSESGSLAYCGVALDNNPERVLHPHIRTEHSRLGRDAVPANLQCRPSHVPSVLQRSIFLPPDLDRDHLSDLERVILRDGVRTGAVAVPGSVLVVPLADGGE